MEGNLMNHRYTAGIAARLLCSTALKKMNLFKQGQTVFRRQAHCGRLPAPLWEHGGEGRKTALEEAGRSEILWMAQKCGNCWAFQHDRTKRNFKMLEFPLEQKCQFPTRSIDIFSGVKRSITKRQGIILGNWMGWFLWAILLYYKLLVTADFITKLHIFSMFHTWSNCIFRDIFNE
ncbi:unnamed protein product [Eretmochelys imbricata]